MRSSSKYRLLALSISLSLAHYQPVTAQNGGHAATNSTPATQAQTMPKQMLERYYQGVTAFKAGELDKALAAFQAVAISAPYDPLVHLSLAAVMQQSGDINNAIAEYQRAIRLRRGDAFAHTALGALLQSQGRLQEAINEYDEAIKLRPDVPLLRLNLGIALRVGGNKD